MAGPIDDVATQARLQPDRLAAVNALPRNGAGKVNKVALRQPVREPGL